MAGVAMLLENSGIIPQLASYPGQQSHRSKMIKESVFLTLLAWVVGLLLTFLWDVGVPLEAVARGGSLLFFVLGLLGLLRFVYAFLFVRDTVQLPAQPTLSGASYSHHMPENPTRAALPSPQSIGANDYSPRSKTKEIVSPPSVTENTTRLLEDPDN